MKRRPSLFIGLAALLAASLSLSGCSNDSENGTGSENADYTIGVGVIMSHSALQAVHDGFAEVFDEAGLTVDFISENALGDAANAATMASAFAENQNIDLILAISTPIALAVANAEKDRPILFSAVTDPVRDGLVPSWDAAGANITGTSDLNPSAYPVALVQEAMPDVQTIGVIYSSSESNSLAQVESYQDEAAELGITLKTQAITAASELTAGLEALAGVDAILVPTDNTVVAAISSVIGFGQERQIPIFCADTSTVSQGTVAARGLSYHDLGRRTGEMAISILRDGVDISTIKPEATTCTELIVNSDAAAKFGLTLASSFVSQGTVVQTES